MNLWPQMQAPEPKAVRLSGPPEVCAAWRKEATISKLRGISPEGKKANDKGNLGQEKEWSSHLGEVRSRDEWKQKYMIEEGKRGERRKPEVLVLSKSYCSWTETRVPQVLPFLCYSLSMLVKLTAKVSCLHAAPAHQVACDLFLPYYSKQGN